MSVLRRLVAGATTQSVLSAFGAQLLLVVSGVLTARTLGPADRGHLALLWLIPLVLVLIGGGGVPLAVTYFVARDRSTTRALLARLVPLAVGQAVVLTILQALVVLGPVHARYASIGAAGVVSLGATAALLAQTYAVAALQGQQRYRAFSVVRLIPPALYAMGVVLLIAIGSPSLTVIVIAYVASWMAGALVGWLVLLRGLPATSEPAVVDRAEMARFGRRALLGGTSPVDDLQLDQLVVGFFVGARALGFYAAALAFTNLPRFLAQSVGLVASSRIAETRDEVAATALARRALLVGVGGTAAVALLLQATVGFLVPALYGAAFTPAIGVVRILLVATLFFGLRRLLSDIARGLGKPHFGSIGEVASIMVTLPLVGLWAPGSGARGVAAATLVGAALSAGVVAALLLRRGRVAIPHRGLTPDGEL